MPHLHIYYLKRKMLRCQLCSTHYAAVQINNCLKRTFEIKAAAMKIMDDFHYKWKPSRAYHKIDTFYGDEWDTKEYTGKSMKNALHVQQYGKRYLSG